MVVCPPIWIFFSLPLNIKMNKVPFIKVNIKTQNDTQNKTICFFLQFLCRCVSHFFLLFLLIITACIPLDTIQSRQSFLPRWYEWVLLSKYRQPYITASVIAAVWVSGLLLTELTTVGERSSVGVMKPIIVFFGAVAVGIHLTLFFIPTDWTNTLLYIRNQFLAWSFLCGMIQILDFLKFHHMFGPWAIIISRYLLTKSLDPNLLLSV